MKTIQVMTSDTLGWKTSNPSLERLGIKREQPTDGNRKNRKHPALRGGVGGCAGLPNRYGMGLFIFEKNGGANG